MVLLSQRKIEGENPMPVELTSVEGQCVWHGPLVDYRAEGMHVLSGGEIAEIDDALAHLLSLGTVDFPEITPETFPLPTLGSFLEDLGEELLHGRGFLLLRGLPRERYSLDDIGLIYYGLGVHLGRPVAQSYQGELLGNVIDVSDVEPRRLPAVAAPAHFIHGGPDPLSRRDDAAQGRIRRLGLPR